MPDYIFDPKNTERRKEDFLKSFKPKIILPGQYKKNLSRKEIIENFLNEGWLPENQAGLKPWLSDLLEKFSVELLLHNKNGISGNLIFSNLNSSSKRKIVELDIVPTKPIKTKIELNEIEGDLGTDVKFLKLNEIKHHQVYDDRYQICEGCD